MFVNDLCPTENVLLFNLLPIYFADILSLALANRLQKHYSSMRSWKFEGALIII